MCRAAGLGGCAMVWVGITLVTLCLGLAVLACFHPDRRHTRPPTYRPERRTRRWGRAAVTGDYPGTRP